MPRLSVRSVGGGAFGCNARYQLPLLQESRLRRLFNLRRACLATPLRGPSRVSLLNTHLSAFSFGDGTVDKQVAVRATTRLL